MSTDMNYFLQVNEAGKSVNLKDADIIRKGQQLFIMSCAGDFICGFVFKVDISGFELHRSMSSPSWYRHSLSYPFLGKKNQYGYIANCTWDYIEDMCISACSNICPHT